jgi:hypothetical protein
VNPLDTEKTIRYIVDRAGPAVALGLTLWWDPSPTLSITAGLAIGLLTIALASVTTVTYSPR